VVIAGLILATLADLALAALLIGVSGFLFGGGPESAHAGSLALVAFIAAVLLCIAAPAMGFVLRARGKQAVGLILAWVPPLGAVAAMIIPAPY
jgi:hypothetical protein